MTFPSCRDIEKDVIHRTSNVKPKKPNTQPRRAKSNTTERTHNDAVMPAEVTAKSSPQDLVWLLTMGQPLSACLPVSFFFCFVHRLVKFPFTLVPWCEFSDMRPNSAASGKRSQDVSRWLGPPLPGLLHVAIGRQLHACPSSSCKTRTPS